MRRTRTTLCAAFMVGLLVVPAAQAQTCKGPIKAAAPKSGSPKVALAVAVGAWRQKAVALHGEAFGSWERAKVRVTKCFQQPASQPPLHTCIVRARPCA